MQQHDLGYEPQLGELSEVDEGEEAAPAPYLSASFQELLEQLAYGAQFTGGIQVVEGPRESGKTTLASVLCRDYLAQCAHLAATSASGASADALLADVASEFGLLDIDGASTGAAIVALRGFAQSLHAQSQVAVLVIDDAHLLDQQTLAALASLLQTGGESVFGLHLVMWSEPGLVERLDALQLLDVPIHDFAVPALAPDEVAAFANFLQACGEPVPEENFQAEAGVQSEYVGAAKRRLLAPVEAGSRVSRLQEVLKGLPLAHVAALSLLVTVLLWALLAREPEPELKTEAIELPVTSNTQAGNGAAAMSTAAPASQAPGSQVPGSQAGAPVQEAKASPQQKGAEIGGLEPVVDERELRQALYGPAPAELRKEPERSGVADAAPPQPKAEAVQESASTVASAAAAPASKQPPQRQVLPAQFDAETLRGFRPESYSLQIMAATSVESLQRFRDEQPNRAQLYLYRTQRQGRNWYLLLAGNYSSKASAAEAIARLPKVQRDGGPWPRKLESVHQEIAQDRRN